MVAAALPALDLDADDFLKAYESNGAAADAMAAEASPPAYAVFGFVQAQGSWTGTATELLTALNQDPPRGDDRRSRAWPKNAKALSDALRRAKPNLAKLGCRSSSAKTTTCARSRWSGRYHLYGDRTSLPSRPGVSRANSRSERSPTGTRSGRLRRSIRSAISLAICSAEGARR